MGFMSGRIANTKRSLYIVGTNGLGVRYGGWDGLLEHITSGLSGEYDIYVYTVKSEFDHESLIYNGSKVILVPMAANGMQSIFYDFFTMLHATFKSADLVLVLGVSGGIFFPFFRFSKTKIILNPDGSEWKRTKFSFLTKCFLKLSEKMGVCYADHVITDNAVIGEEVLTEYGIDSSVIEYGADHVSPVSLRHNTSQKYGLKTGEYIFKVCRIVPENNLEMILKALSCLPYIFVLVGNWNNSEFGKRLRENYSYVENFLLLDPIYDQHEIDELRSNCKIYIHGHSVGGTNPSLIEAMQLGLACLVFNVSYNMETTDGKACYFVDESGIKNATSRLWDDDKQRHKIGVDLKNIAVKKYRWSDVVNKYERVFASFY
jgi:glycosyltransferase involved in cell wall biosynthesis